MAVRTCPNCGAVMPAGSVAVYSYDLVCANCQHPLAISELSRNLAAFAGLAGGAIAWWIVTLRFAEQHRSAGLGVAGVSSLFGRKRGGGSDVNAGGQSGIKRRRSRAAERSSYLSRTSLISKADLFIDSYILRSRRNGRCTLFGRLGWHGTLHGIRWQARRGALSRGRSAAFDDRDSGVR